MEEEEKNELMKKANEFVKTGDVNSALSLPNVDNDLKTIFDSQKEPDKKEQKLIKKKTKKIWKDFRKNTLDGIDLQNYENYCRLQEIRAESDKKLARIRREKEKEEAEHWLDMHKGNLEDIGYNTKSVPNKYFYAIDRYIFYVKNRCKNIPKITWYIVAGLFGLGIVILMALGISKLF